MRRIGRKTRALSGVAALISVATAIPLSLAPASAGVESVETATWTEHALATHPSGRAYPAMAYDAVRNEVVLFGGRNSVSFTHADTWTYNGSWTQRMPASSPPGRRYAGMAFDPLRAETIMYGGRDGAGPRGDMWAWNGTTWTQRFVSPNPGIRQSPTMAYDPVRREIVLFGGYGDLGSTNGAKDDTWVWDGSTWTKRIVSGPPARFGSAMAFDPVLGKIVLFGGRDTDGTVRFSDTWAWDGATWEQLTPVNSPAARESHSLVYDGVQRTLMLFGGRDSAYRNDTWAWNGSTWAQRSPSSSPSPRSGAAAAFDTARARTVLFGGLDDTTYHGDTWTFGARVNEPTPVDAYPSTDCDAGANVLRGYVGDAFVLLRTAPDVNGGTAVCVAADDGTMHLGGKLVVAGAPDVPAKVDEQAAACASDPNNVRVQSGVIFGQPYSLDVTALPDGDPDAGWVCLQAAGMGVRLVVTTASAGSGTRFEPDALVSPSGGYAEEAWPVAGQPSASCKDTAGGVKQRLLNIRVGESDRLALYTRQSGGTTEVCYRGLATPRFAGARVAVTAAVSAPQLVFHGVDANCPFPVITRNNAPTFGVWTDEPQIEPGGPIVVTPNSVCVEVAGVEVGVSVTYGITAEADIEEDTA